jgi:hypothetical protein
MTFDWTITLGNILSTITILIGGLGVTYKMVTNHLIHLETELKTAAAEVKRELLARAEQQTQYLNQRFDSLERDTRELRDRIMDSALRKKDE